MRPLPLFRHPPNDLPHLTTGSASPLRLQGYVGSRALRPARLLFGNSRPRVTTTPLPHATGAYRQRPRRDFNPLDLLLLLRKVRHDLIALPWPAYPLRSCLPLPQRLDFSPESFPAQCPALVRTVADFRQITLVDRRIE